MSQPTLFDRLRQTAAAVVAAILLVSLSACSGESQSLNIPSAIPGDSREPKPLAWWSRAAMQSFLDFNVWNGHRSGFIAAFARDGQAIYATTAGYADIDQAIPMRLDTRVRIASMTKPVTAVAAHILIEEGRLNLDDPVAMYIPAAANIRVARSESRNAEGEFDTHPAKQPLLVRHLFMFTSGIGGGDDESELGQLWDEQGLYAGQGSLAERIDRTFSLPLFEEPGSRWRYGGSADVLARVIEVVAEQPFAEVLQQRIFAPLDMQATGFLPPADQQAEMARIYTQDENKNLVIVEKRVAEDKDWTPGGGGLVSTAGDYMRFALMLWNKGSYNGVQILKPETVAAMTKAHVTEGVLASEGIEGLGWGLGLAVVMDSDATLTPDRTGDFWWAGYFGTTFFVSPETDLVAVVISQNEPGPYSGTPFAVHLAGAFAFMGL